MDARIGTLAARQLGLVTRVQLLDLGVSGRVISKWIASGRLVPRFPGVYAMPGMPRSCEHDLLAALLAAGPPSAVGGRSAGRVCTMHGVSSDVADIVVPKQRRLSLPGVRLHRSRTLLDADVVVRPPLCVTSPVRTLIDLAGELDETALEDAFEDALRRKIVALRRLEERMATLGRAWRASGR